jgi:hypothetical protein
MELAGRLSNPRLHFELRAALSERLRSGVLNKRSTRERLSVRRPACTRRQEPQSELNSQPGDPFGNPLRSGYRAVAWCVKIDVMLGSGDLWVVPAAPLESRDGWRIWYSMPGGSDFEPAKPNVTLRGAPAAIKASRWSLLPPIEDLGRRVGFLTVEIDRPQPGELYDVTIPELDELLRWRLLPEPDADELTFLIASCFWLDADKGGRYAAAVAEVSKKETPAFKLFMGDQLYQDWWPAFIPSRSMTSRFAKRYAAYWGHPALAPVLRSSPNYFSSDDHEYWNNFPERYIGFPPTMLEPGRLSAKRAAEETYYQFQQALNPDGQRYGKFTAAGVSFFIADTRIERTKKNAPVPRTLSDEQLQALRDWGAALDRPGVLVLGQPLFQKAGNMLDYSLANFPSDYAEICALIERAVAGETADKRPHDILVLSGDIHTGRHSTGAIAGVRDPVHEFVASPTSLVYAPVKHTVNAPPGKLDKPGLPAWKVTITHEDETPTIDNNFGLVRVKRGRNGRKRFELELWRVRPNDDRNRFVRALPFFKPPQARIKRLLHKEIELR